jgi:O-antigen ligase
MVPGTRSVLGKLLLLAAAGAGSFGVMLSLSRGAMMALGAGALIVTLRTSRGLFLVLVTLLLTSPLWAPDYVIDRVLESQQVDESVDEVALDMSAEARLQTWRTIVEVVSNHPLDGVGFDGLGYVLPDMGDALGLDEVKDSAHNTFLRMMGEMGVLGLAFFVWLQWACWRIGDDLVRRARNTFDRGLGAGLCGGVIVMAISSAFGDRFFNVQIAAAFWMMVAIAESALLDHARPAR